MSLSGSLGFVPIGEVLRLLSRSEREGAVHVTGDGLMGRVFFALSGISLASTSDDAQMRRHLLNAGLVDESELRTVEDGDATLAEVGDPAAITALLREITVESLYQIGRDGESFDVREGTGTVYSTPQPFELESVLEAAATRTEEWRAVTRLVPDLDATLRFRRDLGNRDAVSVSAEAWKVLSEIGPGSTIEEISDRLGTTRFWTARAASHLIEQSLIGSGEARPDGIDATAESGEARGQDQTEGIDPDQTWWEQPAQRSEPPQLGQAPDEARDEVSVEGIFGSFAARAETAAEDSASGPIHLGGPDAGNGDEDEDTESFLERVFSGSGSGEETAAGGDPGLTGDDAADT